MKHIFLLVTCFLTLSGTVLAQTSETFDIATFQSPLGWQKQAKLDVVQFSTTNNSEYCLINLYRSVPGIGTSKKKFDTAWSTLVKESVNVSAALQMFPSDNKGGWEFLGGSTSFEKDGEKALCCYSRLAVTGKW